MKKSCTGPSSSRPEQLIRSAERIKAIKEKAETLKTES
jgi:hypothetical protein